MTNGVSSSSISGQSRLTIYPQEQYLLTYTMHRRFDEQYFSRRMTELKSCLILGLMILSSVALYCRYRISRKSDAWLEYHQAKTDASILRSTMCRIEGIITEEIRRKENATTLVQSYFLLKVVNSTKKQDQFRISEVPLVHASEHESLVSSIISFHSNLFNVQNSSQYCLVLSK